MSQRDLRLLDRAGSYVRKLSDEEAQKLCSTGKAELRKCGRRAVIVLLSHMTVGDFDHGSGDVPSLFRTTYRETHAGRAIYQLKRPGDEGSLVRWDNHLTFDELRAGQLISRETRERQARTAAAVKTA